MHNYEHPGQAGMFAVACIWVPYPGSVGKFGIVIIDADPHHANQNAHGNRLPTDGPAHLRDERSHLPHEPPPDHSLCQIHPVGVNLLAERQTQEYDKWSDPRVYRGRGEFLLKEFHLRPIISYLRGPPS